MLKPKENQIFDISKARRKSSQNIIIPNLANSEIPQATITVFVAFAYSYSSTKYHILARTFNDNNRMLLNNIIEGLSQIINLENHSISYCHKEKGIYFFCGTYPFEAQILCELLPSHTIWIKLRPNINKNHQLRLELFEEETENQEEGKQIHHYVNKNCKRAKERKIGDIIKKVYLWKKLYEGITDKKCNHIRLTLQDAAEKADISKKSLDEYYNQLKFGKIFGFDFNKHKNDKVGVLRGFVKTQLQGIEQSRIQSIKYKKKLKIQRKKRE